MDNQHMSLEQVLAALNSCGIDPEKYGYNSRGGIYDGYFIEDNKYFQSYPDDFDRPKKIIIREIESEEQFIIKFLVNIKLHNKKLHDCVSTLLCLYKGADKNTLEINHTTLFELHDPLWSICKRAGYESMWNFCIITEPNQLFNQVYSYGIGFIDGKYIVECQDAPASGDRPHAWYEDYSYDNYNDAFEKIKQYAQRDINERRKKLSSCIKAYIMDKEEHSKAKELCEILNKNSAKNPIFEMLSGNTCSILYVRDCGYYSYLPENDNYSIEFHGNGEIMDVAIKSCEEIQIGRKNPLYFKPKF